MKEICVSCLNWFIDLLFLLSVALDCVLGFGPFFSRERFTRFFAIAAPDPTGPAGYSGHFAISRFTSFLQFK